MGRLSNVRRIIAEDFPAESQEVISRLGGVINYFMEEVVQLSNGNVDFENLDQQLLTFEVQVNPDGTPIINDKILTEKINPNGLQVIKAQNLTNNTVYPTGQPFISFTPSGDGFLKINNITGLPADNKFFITVVVY